jgi:4-amino-4-deoxy-L-arabinose transferase-like glycosyltransferase
MHATARPAEHRHAWPVRCAVLAAFVGAAVHRIGRPGLLYDEVLFVNAALGGEGDSFVHARLCGVPVMLMSYVGALKAWLYAPVLAAFGVSPATLRIPCILLAAATLLVLGLLAERLFGRRAGLLFLLVLATDPGSFATSRVDYGPVVLAGLLKATLVWLTFAWLSAPTAARSWAIVLVTALGLFDKLNFLWLVLALAGAMLVVHPRELGRALRAGGRGTALPLAAGVVGVLLLGLQVALPLWRGPGPGGEVVRTPLGERLATTLALVHSTLGGTAWWQLVFRTPPPGRPEWVAVEPLLFGLPLVALATAVVRRHRMSAEAVRLTRISAFFGVASVLVIAAIVATPHAGGPHHAVLLAPLPTFAAFAGALALLAHAPDRLRRPLALVAAALVLAVVAGQIRFDAAYAARLRDRGALQAWGSTAIYGLAEDLQRLNADVVASADWGIHNQLYALVPDAVRPRYRNLYAVLQESEDDDDATGVLREELRAGSRIAVVLHPAEGTYMPRARERLLAFVRSLPRSSVATWPVRDAAGVTVYEVVFLVPPEEAWNRLAIGRWASSPRRRPGRTEGG